MNCRRCSKPINGLWHEWELCDKCGYRYHRGEHSPDGQNPAQTKRLIEIGILNDNGHPTGCGCEYCGGAG